MYNIIICMCIYIVIYIYANYIPQYLVQSPDYGRWLKSIADHQPWLQIPLPAVGFPTGFIKISR